MPKTGEAMKKVRLKEFINMGQYFFWNFDRDVKYYDMGRGLHLKAPEMRRVLEHNITAVNPDVCPLSPLPPIRTDDRKRWRTQLQRLKRMKKYFTFWGGLDFWKLPTGPGFKTGECQMPPEEYRWMMKEAGELFLGWEIGEMDGLFGRDIIWYLKPEERPKRRKDAHRIFMDYLKEIHRKLYQNTTGLCSLTFPHYFHELPVRMLGAEMGQGLLNTQLYISFLRGACRQYGLQYLAGVSVFDRWSHRCYLHGGDVTLVKGKEVAVHKGGPHLGHSLGFFKAAWTINYFASAVAICTEGGYYTDELANGVRQLSPLGKAFWNFGRWAEKNPPRGRQIRPIALMLDYYAGWTPPRHLYSFQDRVVWHCIPYGPSDHGMDRAYDLFYPGYGLSGYYRDERGFITPTPCGDVVDILLNDASLKVMKDSSIIWYISDEKPSKEVVKRLHRYVSEGGHLIISGDPMSLFAQDCLEMKIAEEKRPAIHSVISETGEEVRENFFSVRTLRCDKDWKVYAETEEGLPLIIYRDLGKGKLTFIAADHGLTDQLIAVGFDKDRSLDVRMEPPFELLHSVERYLKEVVSQKIPVEIEGRQGLYYSVNLLSNASFLVCLYNPGSEVWQGKVSLKKTGGKIREISGPWRDNPALQRSEIVLRGNETAVFILSS